MLFDKANDLKDKQENDQPSKSFLLFDENKNNSNLKVDAKKIKKLTEIKPILKIKKELTLCIF